MSCSESFQKLDPSRTWAFLFIYLNYESETSTSPPPENKTQFKLFFICIQTSKSPCAIGPSILKTSCKSHPHPNTISVEVGLTSGFFWQNHLVFFFPLKSYFPSENHSKFYNFFPCGPNINGTKKCVSKLIKVFSTVSKAYQKTSRFGMVKAWSQTKTRGVSHTMALPFTLKSILRQKKNYGNSNISPCQNIIFKKIV